MNRDASAHLPVRERKFVGFRRIFVANRGEVAARIAASCDRLGIEPVFGLSSADLDAPYARHRAVVHLGPNRARDSYLAVERIVQAAKQSGCTALHPGWGFLAESPLLATLCEQHGITFIGPSASVIDRMGRKTPAKREMARAGLARIPGSEGPLADVDEAKALARTIGFPVLLKAESGGGGRGMRVARDFADIDQAYAEASAEAQAAFGDPRLYLERLIEGGRHVELQVLADRYGNVVHLGERDCSIQRHHQKLIEESPAPTLAREELESTAARAVRACAAIGYVGAGTLEFLLDETGKLRFMEMNTRLQVEHGVSEMRSGIDLVAEQIRVAAGCPLGFEQSDVRLHGHAIECRINAEDPRAGFRPTPGEITRWDLPDCSDGRLRIDTHVVAGYRVPPDYDSLLCKLIALGDTRDAAIERLIAGLSQLRCEGVATTVPMHLEILAAEGFRRHAYDTRSIPGWPPTHAA